MNQIRVLLWAALLTMLWLGFSQWTEDYGAPPPPPGVAEEPPPALPEATSLPGITEVPPALPQTSADQPAATAPASQIRIVTDVLDVVVDAEGGDLVRADLLEYPVNKDDPNDLVRLLDYEPATRWIFQTGVRDLQTANGPTHLATYSSRQNRYELTGGRDELVVTLDWDDGQGLSAHKTYTFRRGSYAVELDVQILNDTIAPWNAMPYLQMLRRHVPSERSFMNVDSYSYTGPVLYNGDSSDKPDVEDLVTEPITEAMYTNGWFASIQHHFLAAAVPPADTPFIFSATAADDRYVLTARGETLVIPAGGSANFAAQLFVGPKLQDQLEATAEGLVLTVDYGVLTTLAGPLFWLLDKAHGFLGNWGLAIIAVTFLIKLVFFPLTQMSGRSMAKMRKLAPRLKALQERYKDDRQALSQAMMELYKKEKANPAAGCLPMLIQMPFFFAFYWVLIESVEMRQAPFFGWIDDLSTRDPYFVLPALMAGAMFFQTKLNPTPPDPVQARIMQFMPLIFSVMFAFFPAGLVIYWLTNTVLGIAQQWQVNRAVAAESSGSH
ncbi:MAG: membrane protein insertase YidC [Gammaproteobacteria bacterium]|jgi:YidC/Oxa1 family membrane protein insertase